MSGWREGTKKCYHSYIYLIKKWIKHCDERSKHPFCPTADELIVFLTSLYNQGKGYSCINLARSAVATLSLGSKISVGMHPFVKKFVRGVFNRRPAFPRNSYVGHRYCVRISKEMIASSISVSSTVDSQSGAFMPVSVAPEGSGLMVVGSTQHYLVKDRHSMRV